MMKKILFLTLGLLMAMTSFGQADTLQNVNDSVISRFSLRILSNKARE